MALPLLKLTDTTELVCVYDEAVTELEPPELPELPDLPDDPTDEQAEAHEDARSVISASSMRWIEIGAAQVSDGAVVAKVRPLGKLDQIRLQTNRDGIGWIIEAARLACISVDGPGLDGTVSQKLSRLPLSLTLSLGRWVWRESTALMDPTSASES